MAMKNNSDLTETVARICGWGCLSLTQTNFFNCLLKNNYFLLYCWNFNIAVNVLGVFFSLFFFRITDYVALHFISVSKMEYSTDANTRTNSGR